MLLAISIKTLHQGEAVMELEVVEWENQEAHLLTEDKVEVTSLTVEVELEEVLVVV